LRWAYFLESFSLVIYLVQDIQCILQWYIERIDKWHLSFEVSIKNDLFWEVIVSTVVCQETHISK
jgi:hypothetical protein